MKTVTLTPRSLLRPDEVVAPYEETLRGKSTRHKQAWSARVAGRLAEELGGVEGQVLEFHAGADYCNYGLIERLRARGAEIEWPVEGLSIGRHLSFYRAAGPG